MLFNISRHKPQLKKNKNLKRTPQGGILSPDLFNRYTNSLIYSINAPLSTYTYADDLCARNHKKTKLLLTIEQLQQET